MAWYWIPPTAHRKSGSVKRSWILQGAVPMRQKQPYPLLLNLPSCDLSGCTFQYFPEVSMEQIANQTEWCSFQHRFHLSCRKCSAQRRTNGHKWKSTHGHKCINAHSFHLWDEPTQQWQKQKTLVANWLQWSWHNVTVAEMPFMRKLCSYSHILGLLVCILFHFAHPNGVLMLFNIGTFRLNNIYCQVNK